MSYPIIAGNRVFFTTVTNFDSAIVAHDLSTGARLWGPTPLFTQFAPIVSHAFADDEVFVVTSGVQLLSFNPANGVIRLNLFLDPGPAYVSSIAIRDGLLFFVRSAGGREALLFAVDIASGAIRWRQTLVPGFSSGVAVTSDSVYVSFPNHLYRFSARDGVPIWHHDAGPTNLADGRAVTIARNHLLARDIGDRSTLFRYDPATGARVDSIRLPDASLAAVRDDTIYVTSEGMLHALDASTLARRWTFSGETPISSAPIVINDHVIVGTSAGTLFGVDARSGVRVWTGNAGAPVPPPNEDGLSLPLTGLAAAEGYLIVPTITRLTAFRLNA